MSATKIGQNKWRIGTDVDHRLTVDSFLVSAEWANRCAFAGQPAPFVIHTAFVGQGAPVMVQGMSERGISLGETAARVRDNVAQGSVPVPSRMDLSDRIFFTVRFDFNVVFPAGNPRGESGRVPVFPMPVVRQLRWSNSRANKGDVVVLRGEVENVEDGTDALFSVYRRFDTDAYERVTRIPAKISAGAAACAWVCGSDIEDTEPDGALRVGAEPPPPVYMFTVTVGSVEHGRDGHGSGFLAVIVKTPFAFS